MGGEGPSQLAGPPQLLSWLNDLEKGDPGVREAFVQCCLRVVPHADGASPGVEVTRGQLVFVCHRLRLSQLLECSTTDHN